MNSDDVENKIVALLAELRRHRGDITFAKFMQLFDLLYERAKEGCLAHEDAQMYRQQGTALAMRDLLDTFEEQN